MTTYRDGAPFPTTIFEAAALGYSVKAHCSRCPHSGVFETVGLWWYFERHRWSDWIVDARKRFYCGRCALAGHGKVWPSFIEAVREQPGHFLELPDEREWKRALSRFRA